MNVDKKTKINGPVDIFDDNLKNDSKSVDNTGKNELNEDVESKNIHTKQLKMNFENNEFEEEDNSEHISNDFTSESIEPINVPPLKGDNTNGNVEQLKFDIPNTANVQGNVMSEEKTFVETDEEKNEKEVQNKEVQLPICGNCLRQIPRKSVFCPYCGQKDPINTVIMKPVVVVRNERIRKAGDRYILLEKDNQRNGVLLIDGYYKGTDFNFIFLDDASKYRCGVYQRKDNRIIQLTEATKYYLQCYYDCNEVVNGHYDYVNIADVDERLFIDNTPIEEEKKGFLSFFSKTSSDVKQQSTEDDKFIESTEDDRNTENVVNVENNKNKDNDNLDIKLANEELEVADSDIEHKEEKNENIDESSIMFNEKQDEDLRKIDEGIIDDTDNFEKASSEERKEDLNDISDYEPISKHFKTNDGNNQKNKSEKPKLIDKKMILFFVGAILLTFLLVCLAVSFLPKGSDTKKSNGAVKTSQIATVTNEEIPSIIEDAQRKTVSVTVYQFGQAAGSGSGIVYRVDDKEVYIVTNAHVTSAGNQYKVTFNNEKEATAELINYSTQKDIAVLKCSVDFEIEAYEMGDSSVLKAGETAIAIGSPLSVENAGTVTKGIISAVSREITVDSDGDGIVDTKRNAIQTDAAINPGNSGGALINASGQLIGITNMKLASSEIEGIGYAIPVNDVVEIADKIINEQGNDNSNDSNDSNSSKKSRSFRILDDSDDSSDEMSDIEDIIGEIGRLGIVR